MTEEEWLAATNPDPMFDVVRHRKVATDRKYRLFACACCWRTPDIWKLQSCRHAIEALEAAADGVISWDECVAATNFASHTNWYELPIYQARKWLAIDAAVFTSGAVARRLFPKALEIQTLRIHVDFLRCIFGNPFRPVVFAPSWRSETSVALAAGIYEERAFDRLPILADALEEAGCDHPDVLSHLRGPGPHARGCWVVDGVLGKA
jgi:hypothetical protein